MFLLFDGVEEFVSVRDKELSVCRFVALFLFEASCQSDLLSGSLASGLVCGLDFGGGLLEGSFIIPADAALA
jgi:hypothetical protein